MLAFALISSTFAAEQAPSLPQALLPDNIDPIALRDRAMAGLDHPDRRTVRWMVRNELPVRALEQRLSHQSVALVHQSPTWAVWRVIDRRGTADWLRVDLGPEGELVDWTWLSEGMSASEKLADRAAGTGELLRRAEAVDDLLLEAPLDLPSELEVLHAEFPGEVWADLYALEPFARIQDWKDFDAALDRIGTHTANDPWIEWLHGYAAQEDGHFEEARTRKDLAISFDPTLAHQAYTPGRTRHG